MKTQLNFSSLYKYKMSKKETLKLDDLEIEKRRFHSSKGAIHISDVNPDKIVTSEKFSCAKKGFKYLVSYKNNEQATPLCVLLPKMSSYLRHFDDEKTMSLLVKDKKFVSKMH